MSEQPVTADGLPKWDLSDRMVKSLRHAGLGVAEIADYLDVSPRTVSNWLSGRIEPSDRTARLWALRTGIPYTWFCHGDLRPCDYAPVIAGQGTIRRRANKMQSSQTKIA
jgi:transcriptional regulator with XRE-family HTH domain